MHCSNHWQIYLVWVGKLDLLQKEKRNLKSKENKSLIPIYALTGWTWAWIKSISLKKPLLQEHRAWDRKERNTWEMLPEWKLPDLQRFLKWKINLVCPTGPTSPAQVQNRCRTVLLSSWSLTISGPFLQTVAHIKEEENWVLTKTHCMKM